MNSNKRQLISIHEAFRTLEGDGFEVRRAIPSNAYEAIGPFIFLDQFGPIDVRPGEAKGASAHPHAGIETLTLLLEGSQTHKDSLGNVSSMRPGEVQWMRAGRGVVHDESPDEQLRREGGHVHGVQLWINMPKGGKHAEPAYRHVKASEIPTVTADEGRVVGAARGRQPGRSQGTDRDVRCALRGARLAEGRHARRASGEQPGRARRLRHGRCRARSAATSGGSRRASSRG